MKTQLVILLALTALSSAAVVQPTEEFAKLASGVEVKESSDPKDLEAAASDRTFHVGREYGYGNGGYGGYGGSYGGYGGYGANYPYYGNSAYGPSGTSYYYNRNGLNNVYRGYQSGVGYGGPLGGGNVGFGYYGSGSYGYPGYGSFGYGYENGLGVRGYDRWNSLDGNVGYGGTGYGGYGGLSYGAISYPQGYRGYGSSSYPSGYRGYS